MNAEAATVMRSSLNSIFKLQKLSKREVNGLVEPLNLFEFLTKGKDKQVSVVKPVGQ